MRLIASPAAASTDASLRPEGRSGRVADIGTLTTPSYATVAGTGVVEASGAVQVETPQRPADVRLRALIHPEVQRVVWKALKRLG